MYTEDLVIKEKKKHVDLERKKKNKRETDFDFHRRRPPSITSDGRVNSLYTLILLYYHMYS